MVRPVPTAGPAGGPAEPPIATVPTTPLASIPPVLTAEKDTPPPVPTDRGSGTRTVALEILAVLAVAYTLFFARAILLPLALAFVLALLFRPVVRHLRKRWRLPEAAGAGVVLVGTLALLAGVVATFAVPAGDFTDGIGEKVATASAKFEDEPWVRWARGLQEKFEEGPELMAVPGGADPGSEPAALGPGGTPDDPESVIAMGVAGPQAVEEVRQAGGMKAEGPDAPTVVVAEERPPSLINRVFASGGEVLGGFALALVLLFFLLAEGDKILNSVLSMVPTVSGKREAVELSREAEKTMSRYLGTVSMINAGLGVCIGLAMWAVGLPNPILWGLMAALLNFVPFLGAGIGAGVVFLVAYLEPEFGLGRAALAPLAYLTLNLAEGNFVTPLLLSRTISLSTLAVLIALAFFGWIWGVVGAVLAVPLLSMLKIVCDEFDGLSGVGKLIGGGAGPPKPAPAKPAAAQPSAA